MLESAKYCYTEFKNETIKFFIKATIKRIPRKLKKKLKKLNQTR